MMIMMMDERWEGVWRRIMVYGCSWKPIIVDHSAIVDLPGG